MTKLQQRIIALHNANPNLTHREIADDLNSDRSWVTTIINMYKRGEIGGQSSPLPEFSQIELSLNTHFSITRMRLV